MWKELKQKANEVAEFYFEELSKAPFDNINNPKNNDW